MAVLKKYMGEIRYDEQLCPLTLCPNCITSTLRM